MPTVSIRVAMDIVDGSKLVPNQTRPAGGRVALRRGTLPRLTAFSAVRIRKASTRTTSARATHEIQPGKRPAGAGIGDAAGASGRWRRGAARVRRAPQFGQNDASAAIGRLHSGH